MPWSSKKKEKPPAALKRAAAAKGHGLFYCTVRATMLCITSEYRVEFELDGTGRSEGVFNTMSGGNVRGAAAPAGS